MISGTAALAGLVRTASAVEEPGAHRMLPVAAELGNLLPGGGLRRGSTVAVSGGRAASAGGGTSLMLALLAAASRAGSWCAVVGLPALGALAAAETGIALDRLALVPEPGPDWPTVVAALIDGVDVVVTAVPGSVSGSVVSRLAARARQRGSVLMPFGTWSGADVTLQVSRARWDGLGDGWGRLRRREVTIAANGRGAAARPRELTVWMPGLTTRPMPPARRAGPPAVSPSASESRSGTPSASESRSGTPLASARSGTPLASTRSGTPLALESRSSTPPASDSRAAEPTVPLAALGDEGGADSRVTPSSAVPSTSDLRVLHSVPAQDRPGASSEDQGSELASGAQAGRSAVGRRGGGTTRARGGKASRERLGRGERERERGRLGKGERERGSLGGGVGE